MLLLFNTTVWSQQDIDEVGLVEKLNRIMDPLIETNNYAGNILISQHDSTVFSRSYGMMDENKKLPNDQHTKFMLASTSMIFTSAAIMRLSEAGKLSINDQLSKYYPNVRNSDRITIHHMLAQRSGIPALDAGYSSFNLRRNSPQTIAELIDYFEDHELLFEPGSNYNHGRSEYILLAAIVEKVSGLSFGQYLQDYIFQPLGMEHTGHFSYEMTEADVDALAKGYTEKGFTDITEAPAIHWSVKTGHASIYSTISDMHRFSQAVLNKELLTEDSWKMVLTDYGSHAGYGWFLNPQEDHERFQMNGRSPGYSSYFGIYPEEKVVVIMLSNRYVSLPFFIGPQLAAATFGDTYEVLHLSMDVVEGKLAKQLTGHYQMGPDFYRPNGIVKIKYSDGRLYSGSYPLIPVMGDDSLVTSFIHRHYWSRLTFKLDEYGVTSLQFDEYNGTKLGFFDEWKWVLVGIALGMLLLYFTFKRFVKSTMT